MLITVSFRLISVYSSVIPARSGTILVHSGVILPRSGIFWLIPVYSVPFHSVPVFSNALQNNGFSKELKTYNLSKQAEEYKTMDPVETEELLQKRKEKYCRNKSKNALKQLKRK